KSPVARFSATPISASSAPLTVEFDASASVDPEGQALTYAWDFDGDGTWDADTATASHTYTELGQYFARLRVTDPSGKSAVTARTISVGNQSPEVTLDYPANGSFFQWGDQVPFKVSTNDAED